MSTRQSQSTTSIVSTDASTPREILPGNEMEIDIHCKVSDSTGRPSPSFSGALYWILAVCRATGLLWGKTLKTHKDLFQHLDKLHKWITSRGKVLKVIRSDHEFVTAVVTDWLHEPPRVNESTLLTLESFLPLGMFWV